MRLTRLVSLLVVAGCATHVEVPLMSSGYARSVLEEAWGTTFDSRTYDTARELSKEEREEIETTIRAHSHQRGHVGAFSVGSHVSPDVVVAEVTHLHEGCSIAICANGSRVDGKSPYVVVTRESLDRLSYRRASAASAQEAFSVSKPPSPP